MIDPTHDHHTRHVSDHDSQSSDSGEPGDTGGGDDDAGPTQHPALQPDCDNIK